MASDKKLPTFSMVGYTGAPITVSGFHHPLILDLAGIRTTRFVPIFRGHDPDKIIGHGVASVSSEGVRVRGTISAANRHSRDVVTSAANSFPWQASVGANINRLEFVRPGDNRTVNGRVVEGPHLIARQSALKEVSFVPLGADDATSANVGDDDANKTLSEIHRSHK